MGWIFAQSLGPTSLKENALTEKCGRKHCRVVTLELNTLKTIQKKVSSDQPVRLVSLLFACVAPAIDRALSVSKNERPTTVLASTIEGIYPYQSLELDNCMNFLCLDLPLNIQPLQERLHVIDRNVRKITGHLGTSLMGLETAMVSGVISPIARGLEELGTFNQTTYISNVVGPEKAFTIFGGDRVISMYIYSPAVLQEAVTFEIYTYDGKITIAITAPDRVVKKLPGFLDNIVEGVKDEIKNYFKFIGINSRLKLD